MTDSLASAMAQLGLNSNDFTPSAFDARLAEEENGTHDDLKPRKRTHRDAEDLLAELENDFLSPSPRFSIKWLNHLQKCVVT